MKWFKHHHDIRKSPFVKELMNVEGKEGYFHYIALLELLCEKFDGEHEEVVVHVDDLLIELCIAQRKKLDKFLVKLNQVSQSVYEKVGKVSVKNSRISENFYFFDVPILFDLQDKDFKFATKKRRESDPKNKEEDKEKDKRIKNKEIDKEKDKEIEIVKSDFDYTHPLEIKCEPVKFDLDFIYAEYPRKEGKKTGIEKLKKIIKSQEKYDQVLLAVRNYKKSTYGTEMKFIKQFSSFVSVWEDYLTIEHKDKLQEAKDSIQKRFDSNPFRTGVIKNVN